MVVRFGLMITIVKANFTYLGEKLFGDCGKYRIELITNLFTLLIIVCLLTLHWKKKLCLTSILWNMINSNCKLYNNVVKLSLNNVSTTIGENIRYFMYKYKVQEYDWYESINIIYKKIDSYLKSRFNAKVQFDAAVIRELCDSRDSCSDLIFIRKELEVFIEMFVYEMIIIIV